MLPFRLRSAIEKLRANNAHLMEELRIEQRKKRRSDARASQSHMVKLQNACDAYTRTGQSERRRVQVCSG